MATLNARIQSKHDTDANWALVAASFVPLAGEICVYDTSHKIKVGDGVTAVGSLPFIGGDDSPVDYETLTNKPILVTQAIYPNDQTGTTGMMMGQAIYKIADTMAALEEMIGGAVNTANSVTLMTDANVMDLTSVLAQYGVSANVVAYSSDNFTTQTNMPVISCDGPIVVAAMYTNIPSAGVWAMANIVSVSLAPDVDINEKYASFFLPESSAVDAGATLRVGADGKWGKGITPPISGIHSWADVQRMVKLGHGSLLFPVFSLLNVYHEKFGTITMQVVAHDIDADPDDGSAHTMTLLMLNGLGREAGYYGYAFDETEAICVCGNGLAAGTYYVNMAGVDYSFTLTESVPADGVLAFGPFGDTAHVSSYDEAGGTLIEQVATSESASGTDLSGVSGVTLNGNSSDNHYRMGYGSNCWKQSAIRQWLNASGSDWWEAQTVFDMPPNYRDDDGFLGGLDPEFVAVLLETEQTTGANTVYEVGDVTAGGSYTTADKIFLASWTQVGGYNWTGCVTENTLWTAFNGLSESDEPERVKYRLNDPTQTVWWWLRSPDPNYSYSAREVYNDGDSDSSSGACGRGYAVVAACVI